MIITDVFKNQMHAFLEFLKTNRLLSAEQCEVLSQESLRNGETVVRAISRHGYIDQQVLAKQVSGRFGILGVEERDWPTKPVLPDKISERFVQEHGVLPLFADDLTLTLAVTDPLDQPVLDAIRIASERNLQLRIATSGQIASRAERLWDRSNAVDRPREDDLAREFASEDDQIKDLALDAPVIDLVNRLFREAVATRSTDLHLEPAKGNVVVRRRIDGMLQKVQSIHPIVGRAAVSRIKILAQLNIAERRLPQDGRARINISDQEFDIRVATMPTIHGESISIRFLSASNQVPDINKIGLPARELTELKRQAMHAHGLIIVTGPTGSGKTTTLAAVLDQLNHPSRKILTIEDPVEYQVEGVNQIQVKPEIGLSFASTLRSMLRVDPDIIMIGEMRDTETAAIGVNAALTGHLVLTTLHTNSAAGSVTRLLDLGVPAFLIASTLRCVVAQRLMRKLCTNCRKTYRVETKSIGDFSPTLMKNVKPGMKMWKSVGCDHCSHTGYMGRVAIFELLPITEPLRRLIKQDVSTDIVSNEAKAEGNRTMIDDGLAKCKDGVTTLEELARVVAED
jgi:general secretion pathway protein E